MVYEFTGNDSNTYTYGHRLLFSEEYKYILNAHGDVEVLIESDNIFVHRYRYDAFGNELNLDSTDKLSGDVPQQEKSPFSFKRKGLFFIHTLFVKLNRL